MQRPAVTGSPREAAAPDVAAHALETLLASIEGGVLLEDASGRSLAFNPAAERLTGLSGDELAAGATASRTWKTVHEDGWPLPPESRPARVALRTRRPCRDLVGVPGPGGEM